jgi:hypothetical protein
MIGGVLVISPDVIQSARIGDVNPYDSAAAPLTSAERSLQRVRTGGNSLLVDHEAVAEAAEKAAAEAAQAAAYHRLHLQANASLTEARRALDASDEQGILPMAQRALGVLAGSSAAEQNVAEQDVAEAAPVTAVPAYENNEPVTAVPAPSTAEAPAAPEAPAADETVILDARAIEAQRSGWQNGRTRPLTTITPRQPAGFSAAEHAATSIPATIHPAEASRPAEPATAETTPQAVGPLPQRAPAAEVQPTENTMTDDHRAESKATEEALTILEQDIQFYGSILASLTEDDPKHREISYKLLEAETELREAKAILKVDGILRLRKKGTNGSVTPDSDGTTLYDNGVDIMGRLLEGLRKL